MATVGTRIDVASRPPGSRAPERPAGHSVGWWGMVFFTATETTLFAAFLASYFYLRFASNGPWPPAADKVPDLWWPSWGTGALVLSALPYFLARRAATAERSVLSALGLVVAWLLGAVYVLFQFFDWQGEYPDSTLSKDAYGSLFYTIPGLHMAHVVVAMIMVLVLILRALPTVTGRPKPEPIGIVGIYWYFLIILAIAIYATVYLSPYM